MPISVTINGHAHTLDIEPDTPLLWALRDTLGLTGTKFGCGISACGACTVLVNDRAVRSCMFPISQVDGATVTTIEGLAADGTLNPVQQAWLDQQVPQCGYCQPGFIMATAALLKAVPRPTDQQIDEALTNICRCGTYGPMRRAVHRAAALLAAGP